ncbi:hypothetical protein [Sphingomonas sp. Leaf25]|uniref:hypothetical protein n=1 Tax=Sphingomonas sp. Leaf25 TaxID=1735692 RepID=UPI0012E2E9D1|nr:hypothetical protein [Sphingomonas sp. Leaf25]
MSRIAPYADFVGWSAFSVAIAIVIFVPERSGWSFPLYLIAGALFVVSIVQRRGFTDDG